MSPSVIASIARQRSIPADRSVSSWLVSPIITGIRSRCAVRTPGASSSWSIPTTAMPRSASSSSTRAPTVPSPHTTTWLRGRPRTPPSTWDSRAPISESTITAVSSATSTMPPSWAPTAPSFAHAGAATNASSSIPAVVTVPAAR